jgi:DNA-binding transcriptional LysR family regulator
VRRTAAGEEGELRLGYIGPPTQAFLGALLEEFRRRFPLVTVVLEERTPERVWEMVARGRLSAGITRPLPGQGQHALGTLLLRREPLCLVLPVTHPLATRKRITWKMLEREPLIVLARREGVGLHDEIIAACRAEGFAPRLAHTPSLVGTVLTYVQAGAGVGIVTDSVAAAGQGLVTVPLIPARFVPLVLVWNPDEDEPPVCEFRQLCADWLKSGRMWDRS